MRAHVCVEGALREGGQPIPAVLLNRKFDVLYYAVWACVWPCCVCVYSNSVIEIIPEMANFTHCFLARVDSSALQHSWYSLLLGSSAYKRQTWSCLDVGQRTGICVGPLDLW